MTIKIIFIGPMGAGKTTAIRAISDIDPVTTEAKNTDRAASNKDTTTVAMEYGEVKLDGDDANLGLYGIPGQKQFEYIWPIVTKGALGAILLIDVSKPDWPDQMTHFLKKFSSLANSGSVVIGFNRAVDEDIIHDKMESLSQKSGSITPYFFTDPRDKQQIYELLNTLVINAEIDWAIAEPSSIIIGE